MATRGGKREGAGRKKGYASIAAEKARDFICKELDKNLKPIIKKAIEQAEGGDAVARNFLFERGYGKVAQAIVTQDEEGNDIPLQTVNVATMSDEEINEYLRNKLNSSDRKASK